MTNTLDIMSSILAGAVKLGDINKEVEEALKQPIIRLTKVDEKGVVHYYEIRIANDKFTTEFGIQKNDMSIREGGESTGKNIRALPSLYKAKRLMGFYPSVEAELKKKNEKTEKLKEEQKAVNPTKEVNNTDEKIKDPLVLGIYDRDEVHNLLNDFAALIKRLSNGAQRSEINKFTTALTYDTIYNAQDILTNLQKYADNVDENNINDYITEFNNKLAAVLVYFPKKEGEDKILDIKKRLIRFSTKKATTPKNFAAKVNRILETEQEYLDEVLQDVLNSGINNESDIRAIINSAGLYVGKSTDAFKKLVFSHMGILNTSDYAIRAYKIMNPTTEQKFRNNAKECYGDKIRLLWHGSRNSNWLSLISQKGHQIKPAGVKTTGSMYGRGLYFAASALKSYGYTSANDSIYNKDSHKRKENCFYLGFYKVRMGKEKVIDVWRDEYLKLDKNYVKNVWHVDSVYAKAGVSLHKDEFVIYDPAQATIIGLVEFLKPEHPDYSYVKNELDEWRKKHPWKKSTGYTN